MQISFVIDELDVNKIMSFFRRRVSGTWLLLWFVGSDYKYTKVYGKFMVAMATRIEVARTIERALFNNDYMQTYMCTYMYMLSFLLRLL